MGERRQQDRVQAGKQPQRIVSCWGQRLCDGSSPLEIGSGCHAACGANADDGAMGATSGKLEQCLAEIADTRHAIRVPERDGAVELGLIAEGSDLRS
jgi:hypothetical protein